MQGWEVPGWRGPRARLHPSWTSLWNPLIHIKHGWKLPKRQNVDLLVSCHLCQREAAGHNWHTCDVTSPKWGVTSLQLVRFRGAYKTDCSEATVWKRKTWSQFTKHNLFQALCYNKQSSSDFSNTQPVGSSVCMGVCGGFFCFVLFLFSFVQLNLSECKISLPWHHEVQKWKDCDLSSNTHLLLTVFVTQLNSVTKTSPGLEDYLKPVSSASFPWPF